MRDRLDDFGEHTDVVLVTFSPADLVGHHVDANQIPFPVLIDEHRAAYEAYGLERGSLLRVWGWRALKRYVEIVRRDGLRRLRRPVEDTLQLGGDFVIAPDGTLVYGLWSEGPDDRPSVDELLDGVDRTRT